VKEVAGVELEQRAERPITASEPVVTPEVSYVREDDLPWETQTPHSRRKVLRLDESLYVAIVEWDPGFAVPGDDHFGGEEIVYVLHGTLADQYRASGAGTIIRAAAGSAHRRRTPDGVTFMVVRTLADGEQARIAGH
jgi:anti-sigma factor ChrR (cupin superfamily)